MVLVKYDKENNKWNIIDEKEKDNECLYLDGKLKEKLDSIKKILKDNWDCFFMIDGMEGSGKSTLGMTCAWYLSNTNFSVANICKSGKEAIEKLSSFKEESVLIIDEGDLSFSSRDVFNNEQKLLINLTKVIRFRRLILIIIAPTFFDLTKGISVRRSKFLLHVYTDKQLHRGRFAYFGARKKQMLYEMGKKSYGSYAKPKSDFIGRFTDFQFLPDYHEAKAETVELMLVNDKEKSRYKLQRDFLMEELKKRKLMTYEEMEKVFKRCELPIGKRQIAREIVKNRINGYG